MKINWVVRFKNPYFWIGLVAVVITAMGAKPEMFTSWGVVGEQVMALINNPFLLACVIIGIIGYVNDHTTSGLSDSEQALGYTEPKK